VSARLVAARFGRREEEHALIDMSSWQTKRVDVVDDLRLDPRNVRLELEEEAPQSDIIQDLFANEKALLLVEGICRVGYLTHEVPIAVRRNRSLVVVEGNRRVAALKAIQNPLLVPDFSSRVEPFAALLPDRAALKKIDVRIAPNQADADELIAALHTGNARVQWTPARQAAFFEAQIQAGRSFEELLERYPTVNVEKFVLRSRVLDYFRSVSYPVKGVREFVDSRRFSTSTLARIYESKAFIDLTGIRLDSSGKLRLSIKKSQFKEMARVIALGMFDGNIDTRSVGTVGAPRFKSLLEEFAELVDPPGAEDSGSKSTSGSGDTGEGPKGGSGATQGGSSKGGGKGTGNSSQSDTGAKKGKYLDCSRLQAPSSFPSSVERILGEIAALDVDRFPNATFDLLRTLVEKAIKSYADSVGATISPASRKSPGYVYLNDCLVWVEDHFTTNGPKSLIQVVQKLRSRPLNHEMGNQGNMNAINHNHKIFATGQEARDGWDAVEPLLAELLK
jgi:uncharacterized membrane protein YgcG